MLNKFFFVLYVCRKFVDLMVPGDTYCFSLRRSFSGGMTSVATSGIESKSIARGAPFITRGALFCTYLCKKF